MTTTTLTEQAQQRALVAAAIDWYVDMANSHPDNPVHDGQPYVRFYAEPSGSKYRIVGVHGVHNGQKMCHAFVDATTGDLLKAASWKVPAKGARYNLLTEQDVVERSFHWAGSHLYKGGRK